jgi:ubiquinone/menaquinone biosynthesis C-methylase UbiE
MAPPPIDPDAFKAFELEGWTGAAAPYAEVFGSVTRQTISAVLDAVQARPGVRLLDVACGPGWLCAAAAERGAAAVGIDISAGMLAEAKRRHPTVDFREGDAELLPFAAGEFDAVTMNFGLLHLGRPEQALAEASRVLRPGGHFAFTVWAVEARAFGLVQPAIEAHGRTDVGLPVGPPFFRFSDPDECRRVLIEAGFDGPSVSKLPLTWKLPSGEAFFEVMYRGTARTGGLLRAQTPDALAAIKSAIVVGANGYQTADGIEIPMPAVLTSASKA